jgi:hypothetical protein
MSKHPTDAVCCLLEAAGLWPDRQPALTDHHALHTPVQAPGWVAGTIDLVAVLGRERGGTPDARRAGQLEIGELPGLDGSWCPTWSAGSVGSTHSGEQHPPRVQGRHPAHPDRVCIRSIDKLVWRAGTIPDIRQVTEEPVPAYWFSTRRAVICNTDSVCVRRRALRWCVASCCRSGDSRADRSDCRVGTWNIRMRVRKAPDAAARLVAETDRAAHTAGGRARAA